MDAKTLVTEFRKTSHLEISNCAVCNAGASYFEEFCSRYFRFETTLNKFDATKLGDIETLRCLNCGHIFTSHNLNLTFNDFYINNCYGTNPIGTPPPHQIEKAYLRGQQINRLSKNHNLGIESVLEVSSYDGTTLEYMHKEFKYNVYGIEPTEKAVKYCNEHFPSFSGQIFLGQFESFKGKHLPFERVDCIIFSHSFRQMAALTAAIELIKKLLRPGGLLIIDEGYFSEDILAQISISRLIRNFHTEKNNYFFKSGLTYLMGRQGFELLARQSNDYGNKENFWNTSSMAFQFTNIEEINDELRELSLLSSNIIKEAYNSLFNTDSLPYDAIV